MPVPGAEIARGPVRGLDGAACRYRFVGALPQPLSSERLSIVAA